MKMVRLCLTLTAFLLTTSPSLADEVFGIWLRETGDEQVKFEPCGDAICGNVVWIKTRLGFERRGSQPGVCSSTCVPMGRTHGPAKPRVPTPGQSIQAKCLLKDLPSAPRAASSAG